MEDWLAREPLVPPAIGLCAGIALDAAVPLALWLNAVVFAACGVLLLRVRLSALWRHLLVSVAAMAVGAALHDLAFRRVPETHIVRSCGTEPRLARVTGVVVGGPVVRQGGFREDSVRSRLLVRVERLDRAGGSRAASGLLSVIVYDRTEVRPGDYVELIGTWQRLRPPSNPGEVDWALSQRRQGVMVQMTCRRGEHVRRLTEVSFHRRAIGRIRAMASAAIVDDTFEPESPGARLLEALVLGQRSAMDPAVNDAFVRTGTVHYLSVSGSHVGMLATLMWLAGVITGRSSRTCALAAMIVLSAYAVLTEWNAPVLRSAVMGDLLCVAVLKGRPLRAANWLALSAIVLLVCGPMQLFEAGFQLSFATLMGLIWLSPRVHRAGRVLLDILLRRTDPLLQPEIQRMLNPPGPWRHWFNVCTDAVGQLLAIGVAAWGVGVILGAYHFRQVPTWGWLNSILIAPVVWLVLVLGLLKTVLSAVAAPLGGVLGWPLGLLTDGLITLVQSLAQLPGSGVRTPVIPEWLAAAGLTVLGLWVLAPWLRVRMRWVAAAGGIFVLMAVLALVPSRPDGLKMIVLSVGDGQACCLRLPNGRTLLCDLGARPPFDLERWVLTPLFASERIYGIDNVILSHPDLDHVCGVPELLARRRVGAITTSTVFARIGGDPALVGRISETAATSEIPIRAVKAGELLSDCGDTQIEVLWPAELSRRVSSNDASLVLRVTYAGRRILLSGDIQEQAQRRLIGTADLKADVLILPHHGEYGRLTGAFIRAVDPDVCIRSSGQRDSSTRVELLRAVEGRRYFNTASDGAVEVTLRSEGVSVQTYRRRDGP